MYSGMNEHPIEKPNFLPAIVGYLNENNELQWRIHDRLVEFISHLPEQRQFPAICGIANNLENEVAVLILNSGDLKNVEWHNLEDYM